jgi:cytochrome c
MKIKFDPAIAPAFAAALMLAAPALAEGNANKGKAIFEEECAACHFENKADGNNVGPNLSSVIGRKAGTFKGFRYSDAMKAKTNIWTEANLLRFLAGPDKMVPDTEMGFEGFADKQMRLDVIAYLKRQQGK